MTTSFKYKIIASKASDIHKFNGYDANGELNFYYLLVNKAKKSEFQKKLDNKESISLSDYGEIIGHCKGDKPNDALIRELSEKYGFKEEDLK